MNSLIFRDNDGIGDNIDNCINVANADQADSDSDGIGKEISFHISKTTHLHNQSEDVSIHDPSNLNGQVPCFPIFRKNAKSISGPTYCKYKITSQIVVAWPLVKFTFNECEHIFDIYFLPRHLVATE